MRGLNVPWVTLEPQASTYERYSQRFEQAAAIGFDAVRLWAAPWEVTYGCSVTELALRRIEHFERLVGLARAAGLHPTVCALLHLEFLDRRILQEVADPLNAWPGSPWNQANGGPFRQPADVFATCSDAPIAYLESLAGRLSAPVTIELVNEIDRVTGYRRGDAVHWIRSASAAVRSANGDAEVTVSCADASEAFAVAREVPLSRASVHVHGWPSADPLRSVEVVVAAARRERRPVVISECSLDSQVAPAACEHGEWLAAILLPLLLGEEDTAFPWWSEVILDSPATAALTAAAFQVLDGALTRIELTPAAAVDVSDRALRRLVRRLHLLPSPSAWIRWARQLALLVRGGVWGASGPWVRRFDNHQVKLTRASLQEPATLTGSS